jgi:hypothetical protein
MSDRRRHDEEPVGISDHKRALAISGDERASVKASALREEGRGEVERCRCEVWDGRERVIAGKVQMCFIMIGH